MVLAVCGLVLAAAVPLAGQGPVPVRTGVVQRRSVPVPGESSDTLRLSLARAVSMAAERGARVDAAEQRSAQAEARVGQAYSALLPQVGLSARGGQRTFNTATFGLDFPTPPGQQPLFDPAGEVVGPIGTADVRGSVAQTLFDWSAVERVRAAKAALSAARAGTTTTRERLAAAAAAAYVRGLRAEGRLAALEEDVNLARRLVSIAHDVLDAGVGVRLDATRAEAQLATMQARRIAARNQAAQARLALLRALDLPLDRAVVLTDTMVASGSEAVDVDAAVALALEERSDLAALERGIDAVERQAAAIRAERLPRLALVADDGWIGRRPDNLLNTYDWGVQLSVPVFDGLRRGKRLDEQRARLSELESQRHELEQEVALEVRSAVLDLSAAAEGVEAARARLDLARAEYSQAQERFQAGVAGSGDVTQAGLRLSEARAAYVDARAGWQGARVALAAAEGNARGLQ